MNCIGEHQQNQLAAVKTQAADWFTVVGANLRMECMDCKARTLGQGIEAAEFFAMRHAEHRIRFQFIKVVEGELIKWTQECLICGDMTELPADLLTDEPCNMCRSSTDLAQLRTLEPING